MTRDDAAVNAPEIRRPMGREALAWIRGCAAQYCAARLRHNHVTAIEMEIDAWLALGLPDGAARRVRTAVRQKRGIRLSDEECRAIADHLADGP